MDAKICTSCDYSTRDLFQAGQQPSVSTTLARYSSISRDGNSCPLCALVCTGLRRTFLARNHAIDEANSVDAEICKKYTSAEWKKDYYDWGQYRWTLESCEELVRMRLERDSRAEILFVELGEMRCRYTIERPLKTSSLSKSHNLFPPTSRPPWDRSVIFLTSSKDDLEYRASNWQCHTKFLDLKEWLQNTLENKMPGFLPNRVLELGNGDDESLTADIRLLDGASQKTARYIALSHRWSSPPRIELTKETYSERLRNIPFASLPLLFRDAVTFCRQMGVRYLWIDALCIIQRDETDWRIESGRMGEIYKYADCVILAHFARGDDEEFLNEAFCERDKIAIRSSEPDTVLEISVTPVTAAKETIDESPLSKRGWVFQERMLATRAIHFARRTVAMEVMGDLKGSADRETAQRNMKRLLLGQEEVEPRAFRQLWAKLIRSYSACDLTRDEDKLPAISGLAKILHSSRANQYFLSGLWSLSLYEQLLWVSVSNSGTRFEWRAPSWSWASLNGIVGFLQPDGLVQNESLFINGFSSSAFDEKAAWVDGPCALAVRGSVVEWDDYMIGRPYWAGDSEHICITQNSNLGRQIQNIGRKIEPLRSRKVQGHINGWVSFDFEQRKRWTKIVCFETWKRWSKAEWFKTWNWQRFKRLGFFSDGNQQSKCGPSATTSAEGSNRKWTPLTTGLEECGPKTSDRTLPDEICVRVCAYVPDQSWGRKNKKGKMNHLFLILQRVRDTGDYRRIGVGEVFLEDFFSQVREWGSEANKFKFLGHSRMVTIV